MTSAQPKILDVILVVHVCRRMMELYITLTQLERTRIWLTTLLIAVLDTRLKLPSPLLNPHLHPERPSLQTPHRRRLYPSQIPSLPARTLPIIFCSPIIVGTLLPFPLLLQSRLGSYPAPVSAQRRIYIIFISQLYGQSERAVCRKWFENS